MTLGPSTFHVQLYKGSQHRRFVSLLAFLVLAVSAFGQSPQIVLGSSQIQSSQDTNPSGMAEAFPVTAPTTGQVSSLYVFLDRSNTAATAWVGLYTSWYRHPRTLLTQSIISKPLPGQWNAVAVPPVQVTQGTRYWIALLGLNGKIQFRDSTSNYLQIQFRDRTVTVIRRPASRPTWLLCRGLGQQDRDLTHAWSRCSRLVL